MRRGQKIKENSRRVDNLQTDSSNESIQKIKIKTQQEKPMSKKVGWKNPSLSTPTWKQLQDLFPDMTVAGWQSVAEEAGALRKTVRSKLSNTIINSD